MLGKRPSGRLWFGGFVQKGRITQHSLLFKEYNAPNSQHFIFVIQEGMHLLSSHLAVLHNTFVTAALFKKRSQVISDPPC
jgi:hypothetical protein